MSFSPVGLELLDPIFIQPTFIEYYITLRMALQFICVSPGLVYDQRSVSVSCMYKSEAYEHKQHTDLVLSRFHCFLVCTFGQVTSLSLFPMCMLGIRLFLLEGSKRL